jgi:TonB family protein
MAKPSKSYIERAQLIAAAMLPTLCMAQAAPTQPPALEPNGPWTANFEESMCFLTRSFGAQAEVIVTFRPTPLGNDLEILLLTPLKNRGSVIGSPNASIEILPSRQRFDAEYTQYRPPGSAKQVTFLYSVQDVLAALEDGSALRLKSGSEVVTVRPGPMRKALSVLSDCKRSLLAHWGLDLAKLDAIAVPAEVKNKRQRTVNVNDYPEDALRKGQSGRVWVVWTIGVDGLPKDCRVVASSKVPSLDEAACKAILRHARYEPARASDGRPIESYGSRSVNWIFPK